MITDEELLESVASITGQAKGAKLTKRVDVYKKLGQAHIYGKTRPYWIKSESSFDTAVGDYQINLRTKFPDFMRLRFMWTSNGMLRPWSAQAFHRDFSDDTLTGEPTKYFPIDKNRVQLHPRADAIYTVNTSYYYCPQFDSIMDTPREWRHVVLNYVLMMFNAEKWQPVFLDSIKDFVTEAKYSDEDDVEILSEDIAYDITDTSDNLRR